MPDNRDDATENVATHSSRLQPSIIKVLSMGSSLAAIDGK